jgi:two-component system alkaline phosphatase synthesis response regulator PhoP
MLTVLVVDDEPDVRLIARVVLTAAGFDVQEVSSGEAALEALEGGNPPDVVLLDVRMPGLDGWEVLRRLRSDPSSAELPVVVFTADLGARSEARTELDDGDLFVTKPFQPDDLLDVVRSAISQRS